MQVRMIRNSDSRARRGAESAPGRAIVAAMAQRPPAAENSSRLAAVAGAIAGLALALLFGNAALAALSQGWEQLVLPAYHTLNLASFATCL